MLIHMTIIKGDNWHFFKGKLSPICVNEGNTSVMVMGKFIWKWIDETFTCLAVLIHFHSVSPGSSLELSACHIRKDTWRLTARSSSHSSFIFMCFPHHPLLLSRTKANCSFFFLALLHPSVFSLLFPVSLLSFSLELEPSFFCLFASTLPVLCRMLNSVGRVVFCSHIKKRQQGRLCFHKTGAHTFQFNFLVWSCQTASFEVHEPVWIHEVRWSVHCIGALSWGCPPISSLTTIKSGREWEWPLYSTSQENHKQQHCTALLMMAYCACFSDSIVSCPPVTVSIKQ